MPIRSSYARLAVLAVTVVAVTGMGLTVWSRASRRSPDEIPVYGTVPDFSLEERSGRTITRADLLGKVSVVNLFYTRCGDSCPLQSAHLARLQADMSGASDLVLISITVDPDHDDRDALTAYAARFHADPSRWLFLTGPRRDIYRLAVNGFHLAVIAARPSGRAMALAWMGPTAAVAHEGAAGSKIIRLVHASRFALIDRRARIRGYFDGADWDDIERLRGALGRLLRER